MSPKSTQTVGTAERFIVSLIVDDGGLVARIDAPEVVTGAEYAFYLKRDGERIARRWYSAEPEARFAVKAGAHKYKAVGFLRPFPGAKATMSASEPLVLGPRRSQSSALHGMPVRRVGLDGIARSIDPLQLSRLEVDGGTYPVSCLVGRRKGDHLFVVLGGAVPERQTVTLPRFSRFSWAASFPGTVLCIADPTLTFDDQIRLGWYFGRENEDAIERVAEVVRAVASALGVHEDRVVTYGSSGGGFAALRLAACLGRGARAIAINAQTNILEYSVKSSVSTFLRVCLPGLTGEQAMRGHEPRLSAVAAWSTEAAQGARCLLVQNLADSHHYEKHFLPFLAQFDVKSDDGSENGRVVTMTYRHPSGHAAEPREMLPLILKRIGIACRAE